jgi:ketosteroid isomerase-like protein
MTHQETAYVAGNVVSAGEVPASVRRYFEALNAEDWREFPTVWADDAELQAVGSRSRHGRQEIMDYFRGVFQPWAEHRDQPTRYIVAGDSVVAEVQFTGVTHGGREVGFDAVDIFDLEDGAIARLSTWYDLTWVRRQL